MGLGVAGTAAAIGAAGAVTSAGMNLMAGGKELVDLEQELAKSAKNSPA